MRIAGCVHRGIQSFRVLADVVAVPEVFPEFSRGVA